MQRHPEAARISGPREFFHRGSLHLLLRTVACAVACVVWGLLSASNSQAAPPSAGVVGIGVYGGVDVTALDALRPATLLLMDVDPGTAMTIRRHFPSSLIIGRHYVPPSSNLLAHCSDPNEQPYAKGSAFADLVAPLARASTGIVDAWVSDNEQVDGRDPRRLACEAAFQAGFVERLQGTYHVPSVAGDEASGAIEPQDYATYFRAPISEAAYFGIHAYGRPGSAVMSDHAEDYALRYRHIKDALVSGHVPLPRGGFVLTEAGPFDGWRGATSAVATADDVEWLDRQASTDPYVCGIMLFGIGSGMNQSFQPYDLGGSRLLNLVGDYNATIGHDRPCSHPRQFSPSELATATATPKAEATATVTVTATPTETATPRPTQQPTQAPSSTPTATSTPAKSSTPLAATPTLQPTALQHSSPPSPPPTQQRTPAPTAPQASRDITAPDSARSDGLATRFFSLVEGTARTVWRGEPPTADFAPTAGAHPTPQHSSSVRIDASATKATITMMSESHAGVHSVMSAVALSAETILLTLAVGSALLIATGARPFSRPETPRPIVSPRRRRTLTRASRRVSNSAAQRLRTLVLCRVARYQRLSHGRPQ